MIGLRCNDDIISIIHPPYLTELYIILHNDNSVWINELMEKHIYKHPTCCFCYNDIINNKNNECFLNNMIIILSCNHVFHLNCFMKYCKFNYITNSNNFTTNSNNFTTTNSNNFTTNSNNFTTNSNNFTTTNSNNLTTTNSNNLTNKCSICSKKTPDYLSIFTAYRELIKYIKNKHKEIIGQIF
jgi:hypothetical protein